MCDQLWINSWDIDLGKNTFELLEKIKKCLHRITVQTSTYNNRPSFFSLLCEINLDQLVVFALRTILQLFWI